MNKIQKRRLYTLILFALGLTLAASLIFYSLRQNMNVFFTPSQLAKTPLANHTHIRLGGMVKEKSLQHDTQGLGMTFIVTDLKNEITVRYVGVLPDLFREGKGVIAEGELDAGHQFQATQILAKHDENYMPKKVYEEMRKNNENNTKQLR